MRKLCTQLLRTVTKCSPAEKLLFSSSKTSATSLLPRCMRGWSMSELAIFRLFARGFSMSTCGPYRLAMVLSLVFVLVLASSLPAEESGWKMPNLNPFAAKKSSPPASKSKGWGMPKLWPQSTAKKPTQPSTFSKMQTGTKQFFSKTADVLNPFDDANDPPKSSTSSSWNPFRSASTSGSTPAKKSSWMWGAEEEEPSGPRTVNEFLAQPKPSY